MSATTEALLSQGNEEDAKPKKGRRAKKPKPPKPPKQKRPIGLAPLLLLFALLTAGGAVAVLFYPIPGLTAKPASTPPTAEPQTESPVVTAALDQREQALAEREAELSAREQAVREKEEQLNAALRELGSTEATAGAMQRAAKLYASMSPYRAASLMAQLDDPTALQILRLISIDEAAAIVANMEADRGAQIMRELTRPAIVQTPGG